MIGASTVVVLASLVSCEELEVETWRCDCEYTETVDGAEILRLERVEECLAETARESRARRVAESTCERSRPRGIEATDCACSCENTRTACGAPF